MSGEKSGFILVLAAAFAFAAKTVLVKMAFLYGVDAITALTLRMSFAGLIFGGILVYNVYRKTWSLKLSGRQWLAVVLLGFCGYYLSSFLDFSGLVYIDASLGRMILFLYPTLVVLMNARLKRQPVKSTTWLAIGLCYGGIFLMLLPNLGGEQKNVWLGSSLVFGAAFCYSFYLIGVERMLKSINPTFFTSLALCVSCLCVLGHFFLTHPAEDLWSAPAPAVFLGFLMGAFSTVFAVYAMTAGIARIGASRAALISMIGPVLTFLLGAVLLDERLTVLQIAGMFVIILGVSRVGK